VSRPRVVLKAAVTLDGKMATRTGDSKWITGEAARAEGHRWRSRCDGILVGVGTVLADDPQLTVRHVEGEDPRRIVLDTRLRTPANAKILPAWILTARDDTLDGAEVISCAAGEGGLDLVDALAKLAARGIEQLLVEGGPKVQGALLRAGLIDEVVLFVAPKILGDPEAPGFASHGFAVAAIADAWRLERPTVEMRGDDVYLRAKVRSLDPTTPRR